MTQNKSNALTLADIAEPKPSGKRGGGAGYRIYRVLRWAWHLSLPRKMKRVVTRGGIRYLLTRDGSIDRRLLKDGHWEPDPIVRFFNGAKERGANIFLDVGANLGYYSLLAARLGIFDEIHAFEPQPDYHRRLLGHIGANNFGHLITPHNVAASDADRAMHITKGGIVMAATAGGGGLKA